MCVTGPRPTCYIGNAVDAQQHPAHDDRVLRVITDDSTFRVIVAVTTQTVRGSLDKQNVSGATAQLFGDLLTGAVLVRETMSPVHRVQVILKGPAGRGSLVADTHPDGRTRGLIQLPSGVEEFDASGGGVLQVMRNMAKGVVRGMVAAPPDAGVPAALMNYMQESEQVVSVISTGIAWENDRVEIAGGYVIQLLPEAERGPLMIMTERLEAMTPMPELLRATGGSPQLLLDELLYGMPYTHLEDRPVSYGCQCSREAVVASLTTLSRDQLAEILSDQDVIEMSCDYCRKNYKVGRQHLEGLLQSS